VSVEWTLLALRLTAVVVLYAFLIAAISVIWRELHSAKPANPGQPDQPISTSSGAQPARLRVSAAADVPANGGISLRTGEVFALSSPVTVGRAPDNGIVLPDDCVSHHHARLERYDGEWWLSDLGSRNGTFLNGIPISKPVPVADGDVITLGQLGLKFEADEKVANHR
jgi:pSer/pThr/pTyr-binding forkhead associated (FHA) protein